MEQFFRDNQHTISALSTAGTFLAVIVSLLLARFSLRANRTRGTAYLSKRKVLQEEAGQIGPALIAVSITNTGVLPFRIPYSFFAFRIRWRRGAWLVNPLSHFGSAVVPRVQFPVTLNARASEMLFIADEPTLQNSIKDIWQQLSWLGRLSFHYTVRATVVVEDGTEFKVRISKKVRKDILAWTR